MLVRRPDGGYEGVLWNLCEDGEKTLEITLTVPMEHEAAVLMERVDERTCNPLRAWHVMGEPEDLNSEQLAFLRAAGQPSAEILKAEIQDGTATVRLTLDRNALMRIRILPAERRSGAGYDYSYYCED